MITENVSETQFFQPTMTLAIIELLKKLLFNWMKGSLSETALKILNILDKNCTCCVNTSCPTQSKSSRCGTYEWGVNYTIHIYYVIFCSFDPIALFARMLEALFMSKIIKINKAFNVNIVLIINVR